MLPSEESGRFPRNPSISPELQQGGVSQTLVAGQTRKGGLKCIMIQILGAPKENKDFKGKTDRADKWYVTN